MAKVRSRLPGSFRDPAGFLFSADGLILRQINQVAAEEYKQFMQSGLYVELTKRSLLIPHETVDISNAATADAYEVIKPHQLSFISYPYEWCFSQLKQAALMTLAIQQQALNYGLSLKDSSAYNIQFLHGKPIFIDTLSFEPYQEGQPWVAYRQFCQHFLAPLALMHGTDIRLQQLLRVYIDGIPLDLASRLLPRRSWLKWGLATNIHLHAKAQQRFAQQDQTIAPPKPRLISKTGLLGIIDSLRTTVEKLSWQPSGTEWHNYYEISNYADQALEEKKRIVSQMLAEVTPKPRQVWDLGANTGLFSRIASDQQIFTVAYDIDPAAVEKNYLDMAVRKDQHLLPLVLDLTNPSPNLGWNNQERTSSLDRGPTDVAFALALIHHLAISNNVPFDDIAAFFGRICQALIIEFVPKSDEQVQKLLTSRKDIFLDYHQACFQRVFERYFATRKQEPILETGRTLYLMKNLNTSK